jgi:hypothetical protein
MHKRKCCYHPAHNILTGLLLTDVEPLRLYSVTAVDDLKADALGLVYSTISNSNRKERKHATVQASDNSEPRQAVLFIQALLLELMMAVRSGNMKSSSKAGTAKYE